MKKMKAQMGYIEDFRNKSEEQRALEVGKPLPGFHTARFLTRNFLSLFFGYYACFVSETIIEFCAIVVTAIIIDLLRKRYVPELSESGEELWARFEQESQKPGFKFSMNPRQQPLTSLFISICGYYILIIFLHNRYGPEGMESYFSFFDFFPEFTSHFSRIQEHLTDNLIDVDYPQMVPLTDHLFSIVHAGIILWMICLTGFGNIRAMGISSVTKSINKRESNWDQQEKAIVLLGTFGAAWILVSQYMTYQTGCKFSSFNICDHPGGYYWDLFFYPTGGFFFYAGVYTLLIHSLLLTSPSGEDFTQDQTEE